MAICLKILRAFLFICLHGEPKDILPGNSLPHGAKCESMRTKITAYLNPTIVFLGTKNAAVLAFTLLEYLPVALSFHCAGCLLQHLGIGFHGCTCGPALR